MYYQYSFYDCNDIKYLFNSLRLKKKLIIIRYYVPSMKFDYFQNYQNFK